MERRRGPDSTSKRLRQIVEIARCLIEGSLESRLSTVVERAPQALGLSSASIFLVREDFAGFGDRLSVPGVDLIDVTPRPRGITARVVRTGRTQVVEDSSTHPGVNPQVPRAGIGAFLAVPLSSSAGCLGVMYMNQSAPRKFTREEVRLAEAIGSMVGQAVENARLQERERAARTALEMERAHLASLTATLNRSLQEAELLKDIGQEASAAGDLRELLAGLLSHLRRSIDLDGGSLLLRQAEQLEVAATFGQAARRTVGQRLRRSQQLIWRVLDSGEPLIEGLHRSRGPSALLVPLRWRGQILGVLELHASRPNAFDVPDLNLARKVADQVAAWINALRR